jgi:folate-binding protein YgfZ
VADRVSVQYPEKGIIAVHGNSDLLDAVRNLNSSIILPEDSHREMLHYISDDASGIIAIIPRRRLGWDGFDLWILESSLNDSSLAQLLTEDYRMTEFEFELERLKFGMPQFPIEINDSHLLTESPVDHMVSHSKGCYVGQEVIERIASRGSTPRSIARFRAVKSPSLIGEIDENRERTSDKLKLVTQVDQPENCEQTDLQYGTPIEILRNIEDYMKSDARQEGSSTADGIDLLSIEKRWEKVGEVYSSIATESEIYGFAALKKDLELPKDLQISKDMKVSFSWISN